MLEENLVDVKKLLKNSSIQKSDNTGSKKALVNLPGVEPFYKKKSPTDRTLIFESRFESGNLAAALAVNGADSDYHLLL